MASTRIFGSDGNVACTGHNFVPNTWSIQVEQVIGEVTGYADTWTNKKGGVKRATGTMSGGLKFDAATHAPGLPAIAAAGVAAGSFTLTAVTGCTYTQASPNTAIIRTAAIQHAFLGDVVVTFNIDFNGAVVETWDEA